MLAENLKRARKMKGYSQEEVAEKLMISRQVISKWENGWSTPDVETLVKLSDLYGVSVEMLISVIQESEESIEGDKLNENRTKFSTENFVLIACVSVSCVVPIIGIIVSIMGILYNRKTNKSKIVEVVCFICLILSIYNLLIIGNNLIFHRGVSNVEKLSYLYIK